MKNSKPFLVREKAKLIVDLLKNKDILEEHRANLKKLQEKILIKCIFFKESFNYFFN